MTNRSSESDPLKQPLEAVMRASGFAFENGAWYRRRPWAIQVVSLQKSQYGKQYYLNLGIAVPELGSTDRPKENQCHVRLRADAIGPERNERLRTLLDLETKTAPDVRYREFASFLEGIALPFLDRVSTLDGMREELEGSLKRGIVHVSLRRLVSSNDS